MNLPGKVRVDKLGLFRTLKSLPAQEASRLVKDELKKRGLETREVQPPPDQSKIISNPASPLSRQPSKEAMEIVAKMLASREVRESNKG